MNQHPDLIAGIARTRLKTIAKREAERFAKARPKTRVALAGGADSYLDAVPMHWMKDWPMPFPMLVETARGARLTDIDGNEVDDFCLGDTGSMFGHSPEPVAKAIRKQARNGLTYMLPTEAALEADRDDRDGCQPLRPARGPGGHRQAQGPRVPRLLSRHRR